MLEPGKASRATLVYGWTLRMLFGLMLPDYVVSGTVRVVLGKRFRSSQKNPWLGPYSQKVRSGAGPKFLGCRTGRCSMLMENLSQWINKNMHEQ